MAKICRAKETNIKRFTVTYWKHREKDIFDTAAVGNIRPNIPKKKEKESLKEFRSWNNQTIYVQDKVPVMFF